ncbi:MAG: hypothetical protein QM796_10905 [Chthoniobacteraceae bacterium]
MMELPDYFTWSFAQPRRGSELPTEPDELMDFAQERAEVRLRSKTYLKTKLYALTPHGFLIFTAHSMMDDHDKQQFVTCARLLLSGYEATAAATCMEVMMTFCGKARDHGEMEEHREPKEAVSIMVETCAGIDWRLLPMRRDAGQRFIGFAQSIVDSGDKVSGRFTELLPPIPPSPTMAALCRSLLEEIRKRRDGFTGMRD